MGLREANRIALADKEGPILFLFNRGPFEGTMAPKGNVLYQARVENKGGQNGLVPSECATLNRSDGIESRERKRGPVALARGQT